MRRRVPVVAIFGVTAAVLLATGALDFGAALLFWAFTVTAATITGV